MVRKEFPTTPADERVMAAMAELQFALSTLSWEPLPWSAILAAVPVPMNWAAKFCDRKAALAVNRP